jgi:transcriptional regulator with XRE-family HTH domain
MARKVANPQSVDSVARRLYLLRKSLGYSQLQISQLLGQSRSTWAQYETGERRISIDQAQKLCAVIGVSLDWIYNGRMDMLQPDLAAKLQEQMRKEAENPDDITC